MYVIHGANHEQLAYRGGQDPIVHLAADLFATVDWANRQKPALRWAFTLSNAASRHFEDRADLGDLHEIDWNAVQARDWRTCRDGKQAEFLVERCFPWELVECVGVRTKETQTKAVGSMAQAKHRPSVDIHRDWYYN